MSDGLTDRESKHKKNNRSWRRVVYKTYSSDADNRVDREPSGWVSCSSSRSTSAFPCCAITSLHQNSPSAQRPAQDPITSEAMTKPNKLNGAMRGHGLMRSSAAARAETARYPPDARSSAWAGWHRHLSISHCVHSHLHPRPSASSSVCATLC